MSQLAREIGISRPLLHMHLQRLESAGLVTSTLELSEEGKAMRYFEMVPFTVDLSPSAISAAVETLRIQSVGDEKVVEVGMASGDTA